MAKGNGSKTSFVRNKEEEKKEYKGGGKEGKNERAGEGKTRAFYVAKRPRQLVNLVEHGRGALTLLLEAVTVQKEE